MKSQNYTYEDNTSTNSITNMKSVEFSIIGKDGKRVAVTFTEENAALIVAALNGVAP